MRVKESVEDDVVLRKARLCDAIGKISANVGDHGLHCGPPGLAG
jgi:hypothetical protein